MMEALSDGQALREAGGDVALAKALSQFGPRKRPPPGLRGWIPAQIELNRIRTGAPALVDGWMHPEGPGLAVTPKIMAVEGGWMTTNGWKLTHIRSGKSVYGAGWTRAQDAAAVLRLIGPVTDWTQSATDILYTPGIMRQSRAIIDDFNKKLDHIKATGSDDPNGWA